MSVTGNRAKKEKYLKIMDGKIKSMRLRNDVIEKIQTQASLENRLFSNMVETILVEYIKDLKE